MEFSLDRVSFMGGGREAVPLGTILFPLGNCIIKIHY